MKIFNCLNCGTDKAWHRNCVNKYCDNQCQMEYQTKDRVRQWLDEKVYWNGKVPNWVRKTLAEKNGNFCSVCKITDHCGKLLVLEVDHIDGNHTNNVITNLRLICPNCHSQTDTYKNRNAGNGRSSRRIKS